MRVRGKTTTAVTISAVVLTAGLSGFPCAAQERPDGNAPGATAPASGQSAQSAARHLRASQLVGMEVSNAQGEDLGRIEDLIVDVNNRRVHYAVLSFGGFMGLGDKRFAYPMRTFQAAADGEHLVLNVPEEALKAAPGFDRGSRMDWNDARYRGEVDRYFGDTVEVKPRPNMMLRPARGLLDAHVTNLEGADVGDVEDFIVDLRDGQVRYVVVELDDELVPDDQLAILPLQALKVTPERNDVTLMLDAAALTGVPTFDEDRWPDFADGPFRNRLDRDLAGVQPAEPGDEQAQSR